MGFLNTNPPLPRGCRRRGGQETGDRRRDEQRADLPDSHGSSDQDADSKGLEYGAMNCSRPWWLILLHRMPGIQGNWSMAATEDTRFNAWEWLWPLCGRTLPDRRYCRCSSIYSACSPPFTGGSLLQIGKTLPQSDGTPDKATKGQQDDLQLGVRTPADNLRTITGTHPRLRAKSQLSTL